MNRQSFGGAKNLDRRHPAVTDRPRMRQAGQRILAIARHALVVTLLAGMLAGCATAPQSRTSKAPDPKTVPPYEIHLLAGGTEMELAGGMPFGTTEAVRQMLNATPAIKVIHLNSTGGQAIEGYRLGLLIQDRHLTTYTATNCASACTLAFIAGTKRYLAPEAWLGFHSASQTMGGESWETGNVQMRKIYEQAGLPDSFIDKALATPPSEIWFPTHQELTEAHVIDGVVDDRKFAVSGIPSWQNADDIDATLKADRLFSILATHDPANYEKIRAIFLDGAKSNETAAQINATAMTFTRKELLPAYVQKAPDSQLVLYQKTQLAEVEYLAKNAPSTCVASAFSDVNVATDDMTHRLPLALQKNDIDSFEDLADAALTQPRAETTDAADHLAFMIFLRGLTTTSPDMVALLAHPKDHINEPDKLCGAYKYFYQALLDQPEDKAAAVSRALLGKRS